MAQGFLCNAKASFISKHPEHTDDPLAYRVLLILPVLYRRWASTRLECLKPWIRQRQLDGMYAGVEGVGADDAWRETSLRIEHNATANVQFSGGATDIFKCFDQIVRQLLYYLATVAGMPLSILNAYI